MRAVNRFTEGRAQLPPSATSPIFDRAVCTFIAVSGTFRCAYGIREDNRSHAEPEASPAMLQG
jgi:hypothetical protein